MSAHPVGDYFDNIRRLEDTKAYCDRKILENQIAIQRHLAGLLGPEPCELETEEAKEELKAFPTMVDEFLGTIINGDCFDRKQVRAYIRTNYPGHHDEWRLRSNVSVAISKKTKAGDLIKVPGGFVKAKVEHQ